MPHVYLLSQLGLGSTESCETPRLVTALEGHAVTSVACGAAHTCAVTVEGKLFAWGDGNKGQLGTGNTNWALKPVPVVSLLQEKVLQLASGNSHSAAITIGGRLYTWGDGDNGQVHPPHHDPDVTPELNLHSDYYYVPLPTHQLGHTDSETHCKTLPTRVTGLPPDLRVSSISCGAFFTAAATEDGQLWTWGNNAFGQLGIGSLESRWRFTARVGGHVLLHF